MKKSAVSIFSLGRGVGSCSGVVLFEINKRHYVLTAKHCVGVTEEVYVNFEKAAFFITSANDDLALVVTENLIKDREPITRTIKPLEVDTKIHLIGFPTGYPKFKPYLSSGEVIRTTDDWYWTDMMSESGCSGGGIFDDDGHLVGILWGGYKTKGKDISIFEPIEDIDAFLTNFSSLTEGLI